MLQKALIAMTVAAALATAPLARAEHSGGGQELGYLITGLVLGGVLTQFAFDEPRKGRKHRKHRHHHGHAYGYGHRHGKHRHGRYLEHAPWYPRSYSREYRYGYYDGDRRGGHRGKPGRRRGHD